MKHKYVVMHSTVCCLIKVVKVDTSNKTHKSSPQHETFLRKVATKTSCQKTNQYFDMSLLPRSKSSEITHTYYLVKGHK